MIAHHPHPLYCIPMDPIEKELLHRIITDRPFAEYITQRIDIGDFDDEVANKIYDGIVDLVCQGKQVTHALLFYYFLREECIVEVLANIMLEGK